MLQSKSKISFIKPLFEGFNMTSSSMGGSMFNSLTNICQTKTKCDENSFSCCNLKVTSSNRCLPIVVDERNSATDVKEAIHAQAPSVYAASEKSSAAI